MARKRGRGRLDRAVDKVAEWLLPDPAGDAAAELKDLVSDPRKEKPKKG